MVWGALHGDAFTGRLGPVPGIACADANVLIRTTTCMHPLLTYDPCVLCRGMYENWRWETSFTSPNFWAVFFYCPAPSRQACLGLLKQYSEEREYDLVSLHLTMFLESVTWDASFAAQLFQPAARKSKSFTRSPNILDHVAICATVPYTSTDKNKALANGAMIFEWVRYYARLGIKTILYDRDGANGELIFESDYGAEQRRQNEGVFDNFLYYNYTIRGLLDTARKGMRYDNTEGIAGLDNNATVEAENSRRGRFESQGAYVHDTHDISAR
jgi:hypothetical protein